jgi:hypothetical protein
MSGGLKHVLLLNLDRAGLRRRVAIATGPHDSISVQTLGDEMNSWMKITSSAQISTLWILQGNDIANDVLDT